MFVISKGGILPSARSSLRAPLPPNRTVGPFAITSWQKCFCLKWQQFCSISEESWCAHWVCMWQVYSSSILWFTAIILVNHFVVHLCFLFQIRCLNIWLVMLFAPHDIFLRMPPHSKISPNHLMSTMLSLWIGLMAKTIKIRNKLYGSSGFEQWLFASFFKNQFFYIYFLSHTDCQ